MRPRILVIRGGAIGDFVLTLPAIRLLRENFPHAHLEILGYRHIVALAEGRFYADAVRSIEYAALAQFFIPNAELDPGLIDYFASFQQVVSYLFDPDGIFEGNVRRCGVKNFLACRSKLDDSAHAAHQLARPLQSLALFLEDASATLHPNEADRAFAENFLAGVGAPFIALHPGSGSERKNWPLENWLALGQWLMDFQFSMSDFRWPADTSFSERPRSKAGQSDSDLQTSHRKIRSIPESRIKNPTLLVVGGEADETSLAALESVWRGRSVRFAKNLLLPHLAALLERCTFYCGHDSGVSHIAAATGAACLLLFGPTDPQIWSPVNPHVCALQSPDKTMRGITLETVQRVITDAFTRRVAA